MNLALKPVNAPNTDRLGIMLFLATALHGIVILGVGFTPDLRETKTPPALEVILADKRSELTPDEAEYLAEISQDGGGDTDDYVKPSSPFVSAQDLPTDGIAPVPLEAGAPDNAEANTKPVLTRLFSDRKEHVTEAVEDVAEPQPTVTEMRIDQQLEIARLTAELDTSLEKFAKRPRKTFLTARTKEATSARYMHAWVEKVERMGNLN